jgi:hypothetical protein
MGEIKSTLDLVLEKTRHLTLSDEEKRQQKQKELRSRVTGLLQRYQDGNLDIQKVGEELDQLLQTEGALDESSVREEIMGRIGLDRNNQPWFVLLQTRWRFEPAGLQSIEADYYRAVEDAANLRREEAKKELFHARRIGGSAVVPNLNADTTWAATRQSIGAEFHARLTGELEQMKKHPPGA